MKHFAITLLLTCAAVLSFSQEKDFIIKHFKEDALDISAREHEVMDINDEPCALLKIRTGLKGLHFEGNRGIEKKADKQGEVWVWVPAGTRILKISKPGFPLKEYTIPVPLKISTVYTMRLSAKGDGHVRDIDAELFSLNFKFDRENVYVAKGTSAPMKTSGKVAVFQVPEGMYEFTVSKEGFQKQVISVPLRKDTTINISLTAGKNTSRLRLPGIVTINSEPKGADVYLNDQLVGKTPYTGQLIAGPYSLKLSKKMHHDYNANFVLEEGASKELPVIEMKPGFAFLSVNTSPENAKIFLDGKIIGASPLEKLKIESGKHTIRTELDDYHGSQKEIDIADGQHIPVDLNLKKAYGTIEVTSEPTGARLFVNGEEVGTTPWKSEKLEQGQYILTAKKELRNDAEETVELKDGQELKKLLILTRNSGILKITAKKSKIYINDKYVDSDEHTANLKPGQYTVRAVRPQHKDAARKVFIANGMTETVSLDPEPRMGSISVITSPAETKDAEILINGELSEEKTPAVIPLLIGSYDITIRKDGYIENTRKITVSEGENTKVEVELMSFKGSIHQKLKRNKLGRTLWLTSGIALAGTGVYMMSASNASYSDYETATIDASDLRSTTEKYDKIGPVLIGIGSACLVPMIINQVKIGKQKKQLRISAAPQQGGLLIGMRLEF